MSDLQTRNLERWRAWMLFDNGKYGYYLRHYDAKMVRFAMCNKPKQLSVGNMLDIQEAGQ